MLLNGEKEGREKLVEYGKKLLETGLVQGTWGNLSIRLDDRYMIVSPSGIDYERITPEDIVKVDINTLDFEGENKPTSEKSLHAGVYAVRPDVNAVIHTHSKNCSIFAACHMPLQVEDPELMEWIGEIINISEYGFPGTQQLTENTLKALYSGCGCIMANHGMLCCGADIEDAFEICGLIEKAAESYIDKRWDVNHDGINNPGSSGQG